MAAPIPEHRVAILLSPGTDTWLQSIDVDMSAFVDQMMGSWIFGYVQAMQAAGMEPVIIATSALVSKPNRSHHRITSVPVWILPVPFAFRVLSALTSRILRSSWRIPHRLRWLIRQVLDLISTPRRALMSTIQSEKCTALLVQEYESARMGVAVSIGRDLSVPVVGTFTGASRRPLFRRRNTVAGSAALIVCATSEIDRVKDAYALPAEKIAKVHYAVDDSVWYEEPRAGCRSEVRIPQDALVLVYHGAIDIHVKGLDILVDAFRRLLQTRPDLDVRLVMLGSGRDGRNLSKLVAGLESKVVWANEWVHDRNIIRRYLSASDIYVFPSRYDAFGISVIEAMACGLPVIAASSPGVPDIFPDGEASGGIVIPRGDSGALAAAIERMAGDKSLRERLGSNAQARVRDTFSVTQIGRELRRVFDSLNPGVSSD